jgi:hypothetical protein
MDDPPGPFRRVRDRTVTDVDAPVFDRQFSRVTG